MALHSLHCSCGSIIFDDECFQTGRLHQWLAHCNHGNVGESLHLHNLRHYMALHTRTISNQYQVKMSKCLIFIVQRSFLWIFRNASLGSCSLVARVGGILANLVGTLADVNIHIPTVLFGSSALLSAALSLMLPETGGKPLPETIEDCIQNESKSRGQRPRPPPVTSAPPSYDQIEME